MNYYYPKNHHPKHPSPHFIKLTHHPPYFHPSPLTPNFSSTKHINHFLINPSPNIKSNPYSKHTSSNDSNSSSSNNSSISSTNISFSLNDKIFSPHDTNTSSYPEKPKSPHKQNYSTEHIQPQKSFDEQYRSNNELQFIPHNKTLVLDLDETLVHSSFKPFHTKPDIQLKIKYKNIYHNVYVLKRPYVDKFLYIMSKYYNIVIFTASIPEYAEPLLDKLDKYHVIQQKFYRKDCTYENGLFIKDLKKIGVDLKNVLLVDNNPISYKFNIENGVPIKSWHDDKDDIELDKMITFLAFLSEVDDVRKIIREVVYKEEIHYGKVLQMVNKDNRNRINEEVKGKIYMERSKSVRQNQINKGIVCKKGNDTLIDKENVNTKKDNDAYINTNYHELFTSRHNRLKEEIINDINNSNPKINGLLYHNNDNHQFINKSNIQYNSNCNNSNTDRKMFSVNEYQNNNSFSSRRIIQQKEIHPYFKKSNLIHTAISPKYINKNIQYSANVQQPRHKCFIRDIPYKPTTQVQIDNKYPICNPHKSIEINNNENHKQNTNLSAFSKETNYYLKRKMICRHKSQNQLNMKKAIINKKAFSSLNSFYKLNTQTQRIKANIH